MPDAKHLAAAYDPPVNVALMQCHGPDFSRFFVGVDKQGRLWRLVEPVEAFRPWGLTVQKPAEPSP